MHFTARKHTTIRSTSKSLALGFYSRARLNVVQKTLNYDEGLLFSDDVIITTIFFFHFVCTLSSSAAALSCRPTAAIQPSQQASTMSGR